jgi:tRNA pseudouridine55 synthase
MFGLLNINKPSGITSRRVVDYVQRLTRPDKAGHAGTLDPLATGVLVVCVGPATRLVEYIQRMPKSYRGRFFLGQQSPTDDIEGEVTQICNPPVPSQRAMEQEVARWIGTIKQRPPIFSALKVKGRRSYDLARTGRAVRLSLREVTIHAMRVVEYVYPELVLDICCSSGTYVRAVGRDLAESLGTRAVMSSLTRTAIGGFHLEDACGLDSLSSASLGGRLLPALRAVEGMPMISLTPAEATEICNGRKIARDACCTATAIVATYEEQLLAVLRKSATDCLVPAKVFPVCERSVPDTAKIAR